MLFGLIQRPRLWEFIPWEFMVDERTVATNVDDGGLMMVAHLVPLDLETSGPLARDIYHDKLAELFGRIGRGYTLWLDQWRWRSPGYLPECGFGGCIAAQRVDAERRYRFAHSLAKVFANDVYLTIHYKADRGDRLFQYLLGREQRSGASKRQAVIDRFHESCQEFLSELSLIFGRRVNVLVGEALGSYLSQCVNYEPYPCFLPSAWINKHLASATWITGLAPQINQHHVRSVEVFTIGALTSDTIEALHGLEYESRWVVRFDALDRDVQSHEIYKLIGHYDQKRKNILASLTQWWTGRYQEDTNLTAAARVEEAKQLRVQVEMAEAGFGKITCNVHTWDKSPERADIAAEDIMLLFKGRGLRAEIAKLNTTGCLLADIPGNQRSPREISAFMGQITRMSPVTGILRGASWDHKWNGPALLVGASTRDMTVNFCWHSPGEDVGNTALIGQSGGGKSFWLALAALESLKYDNCKVILFDRHRSFMVPCYCAGGDHIELGEGMAGVQPLRNIHVQAQFTIAQDWLERAVQHNGVTVDDDIKLALTEALRRLARRPLHQRTITGLIQRMGESRRARDALRSYTADGQYGPLLDGVVESYGKARIVSIECNAIMGLAVAPLVISAVFNANHFERMHTGDPFVVMFDEAQAMLSDPVFASEIDYLAREIRKAHGVLVLATQAQQDFSRSPTTRVIFDQMKNRIYLPDPNVLHAESSEFLRNAGLEQAHIEQIAHGLQKADYFVVCPQYSKMLGFRVEGDAADILARPSPTEVIMCSTWVRSEGVKPGPEFMDRWLEYRRQQREREVAA